MKRSPRERKRKLWNIERPTTQSFLVMIVRICARTCEGEEEDVFGSLRLLLLLQQIGATQPPGDRKPTQVTRGAQVGFVAQRGIEPLSKV